MARSIDRDEVQRLMGQGAQIVDVLPAREYAEDHLPGAVNLPLRKIEAAPADGKTVEVAISNFTFTPNELMIAPGTTVKWVNHDDIPHLVAEKALAFKSQALDTNDSFSFTFTKPGDVEYFCVLHPHMIGKITVKAGGA